MHYSLGGSIPYRKRFYIISCIVIIILLTIGIVRRSSDEEITSTMPSVEPTTTLAPVTRSNQPTITVYNHETDQADTMDIEDYIVASVAGEMPASFHIEALKAQSIAARTLAYRHLGTGRGCNQCDICTESSHIQGFLTIGQMQKVWGDEYAKWLSVIERSVVDTRGQIITYDGNPIDVLYHASSNGKTENSGDVFVSDKPYLVSVSSYDVDMVVDSCVYTRSEFISLVNTSYPTAKLNMNTLDSSVQTLSYTSSNRVEQIKLGGATLTGREFRQLFALKSTEFYISIDTANVTITTKGYGHGVGMSQRGANEMAKRGYSFEDILCHYYTGTQIETIY